MGRHGITLEDVKAAIQQLDAAGTPPTIDNIRETLGSGSRSTITRHLHTLKLESDTTPKNLPPEILTLVSELWSKLQSARTDTQTETLLANYLSLQKANTLLGKQLQVRSHAFKKIEGKFSNLQQLLNIREKELSQKNIFNQELAKKIRILSNELQQMRVAVQFLRQQVTSLENTNRALLKEKQILEEKLNLKRKNNAS